eukprot:7749304-Alexandrium_andersonii.AAC.1
MARLETKEGRAARRMRGSACCGRFSRRAGIEFGTIAMFVSHSLLMNCSNARFRIGPTSLSQFATSRKSG